MNQGRIWCVVHPTVGLPLFIGGVLTTSFIVHASVMSHTTWMSKFFEGNAVKAASAETTVAPVASNVVKTDQGYVITVTVAPDQAGQAVQVSSLEAPATLPGSQ
jgi:light-harvesting protein B-800-850 alpha chain